MKEILVWGNPEKEFERLGVQPKLTWQGYGWDKDEEMRVYEVNEDDFKILCDEEDDEEYWQDAGWRYCTVVIKVFHNLKLKLMEKI
jgi:hypothetical protein